MFQITYDGTYVPLGIEQRLERVNNELKHLWHEGPGELAIDFLWRREHYQHLIYTRAMRRSQPELMLMVHQWERCHNRWEEARDVCDDPAEADFWFAEAEGWAHDIWLEAEALEGRFWCEKCHVAIVGGVNAGEGDWARCYDCGWEQPAREVEAPCICCGRG